MRYFLKTKHKLTKTITEMIIFMSKEVSLPNISLILQKMKISLKRDICLFCMKSFIYSFSGYKSALGQVHFAFELLALSDRECFY